MSKETLYERCPPQIPEDSATTTADFSPKLSENDFFEDLCWLKALYRLRQRYAVLPPEDRIVVPTEPQESVKPRISTIVFNDKSRQHLARVEARQREFDAALGSQRTNGYFSSYNPVFDRVNFELAETDEAKCAVQRDMDKELQTTLRERYHTPLSIVKYVLNEEGVAYGKDDLSEPADAKFQRGALYRIGHGSLEAEREQQTVEAGIIAKRKLADPNTPIHSKAIVVSPPGVVEGTAYQDNFVNIFVAEQDSVTGKRIIRMFLFASSLSNDEYRAVITRFQPDFFTGKTGAFDVQCLDPIFIDARVDARDSQTLFNQEFRAQEETTKEDDFRRILAGSLSVRQNYIDVVCGKAFNPREIALAFNAVLNKADAVRREIISRGKDVLRSFRNLRKSAIKTFKNIKEEAAYWGRQLVEKVMAGCGISGGFSLESVGNAILGVVGMIKGISSFGSGGEMVKKGKTCIRCGEVNYCTKKCYKCGGVLI